MDLGNKGTHSLIKLAFAFFLLESQFWFPIWVIFFMDRGISFFYIVVADVIFRTSVIIFEFPVGIIGDRLGRKKTYFTGAIVMLITFILMILTYDFVILIICWIFWALGLAIKSGTDKAYIYEIIAEAGKLDKVTYIFGYFTSIQNLAFLITHFFAGFLYELNSNLPILFNVIFSLGAAVVILSILNPKSGDFQPTLKQAIINTKKLLDSNVIRNVIVVMAFLLTYFWTVTLLFQPLLTYLGFEVGSFGYVYIAFTGLGIIGGVVTGPLVKRFGKIKIIIICIIFCVLSMLFTGIAPGIASIFGIMFLSFFYYIAESILKVILNNNVENEYRASIISFSNLVASLLMIFSRPLIGFFNSVWNAQSSFFAWFLIGVPVAIALIYLIKTGGIK